MWAIKHGFFMYWLLSMYTFGIQGSKCKYIRHVGYQYLYKNYEFQTEPYKLPSVQKVVTHFI